MLVFGLLLYLVDFALVYSQGTYSVCQSDRSADQSECFAQHVTVKLHQLQHKMRRFPIVDCDPVPTRRDCAHRCQVPQDRQVLITSLPTNCKDIYDSGERDSGVYTIYEPLSTFHHITPFRSLQRKTISVYCDLDDTYGGPGWLVFQRRRDGSVNFTQLWDQYKDGFGNLNGEHWLGNDNLALITQGNQNYELRIDLGDWSGERRYALYNAFKVHNEANKYKLQLRRYSGDAGDSMNHVRSAHFSTIDRDNDEHSSFHCAVKYYQAGFWYRHCAYTYLNNPYHNSSTCEDRQGIVWNHWHGDYYSLKYVEMKIRPTN